MTSYQSKFSLAALKQELNELGIHPKKSLGQNFLVNRLACQRIVSEVKSLNPSQIIEVGPGLGALTSFFTTDEILLIELDEILSNFWKSKGYNLISGDALRVNWHELKLPKGSALVSNLPYQISSRLVIDRGLDPKEITGMVLMFQKEVASRILSKVAVGDYGILSVVVQSFWNVKKLFEISSKDFYPPPQIASQVLLFQRIERSSNIEYEKSFIEFVKLAFSQRRKMMVNNLANQFNIDILKEKLRLIQHSEKVRAEQLNPTEFWELFSLLQARL